MRKGLTDWRRAPSITRKSWSTTILALLIPALFLVVAESFSNAGENIQSNRRLTLFVAGESAVNGKQKFEKLLRQHPSLSSVQAQNPARFNNELKTSLPLIYELTPAIGLSHNAFTALARELTALNRVEYVDSGGEWSNRLRSGYLWAKRLAIALTGISLIGAMFFLAANVKLDMRKHRDDVTAWAWLGATSAFIRRPYLWRGALLGFCAGLASMAIAATTLFMFYQLVQNTAVSAILPSAFNLPQAALFTILCVCAGLTGTAIGYREIEKT